MSYARRYAALHDAIAHDLEKLAKTQTNPNHKRLTESLIRSAKRNAADLRAGRGLK